MRHLVMVSLGLAFMTGCTSQQAGTFNNPVLSGFYPDPSICRVGDDYYLVNSSFEYFPGVPIFHSRNLVHWKQIGHCLTRKSQLSLDKMRASGGIYAPTIRYHKGTFYMITTNVDGKGNFYVTAKDPAGPWSEPVWLDRSGFDPSLFFDDDGKVYYIRHEGQADGYIAQGILNLETGKLEGPLKKIWAGTGGVWAEGPHMYKINGKYYLMVSEGGTSYDHCVTIARSDSPWGPFESNPANPILTHRNRPDSPFQALGHADLVETADGWWMVFLGIRPQGGRFHHIGRETFLAPVVFDSNGWPVVNKTGTIEPEMPAPKLPHYWWKKEHAKDNFSYKTLSLQWNYLRNPNEADYVLTERPSYLNEPPGSLRLYGSAITLSDKDSPTFVGRRQTDFNCVASTLLEFDPKNENEEAGLVVRANDKNHYEIGLTLRDGRRQVLFRKVIKGKIVEPVKYIDIRPGAVLLIIRAYPLCYEFSCSSWFEVRPEDARWSLGLLTSRMVEPPIILDNAQTKDLSVEAIGFEDGMCFTGVYLGMYATGNGKKSETPADFDWFEYDNTLAGDRH